jgi:hypothetical protein
MDEHEAAYLKQQVRDLDRARRVWKAFALSLLAAGALFLILGMGSLATYGFAQRNRAVQAEREAMMEAQMQAERARAAEMAAKAAADKLERDRGQKGK